jgi:hypothetical protein
MLEARGQDRIVCQREFESHIKGIIPIKAAEQPSHQRDFDIQIAVAPAIRGCGVSSMQFAWSNQITCAWHSLTKRTPALKCTSASEIEAHGVEVVHVRAKEWSTQRALMTSSPPKPGTLAQRAKSLAIMSAGYHRLSLSSH